LLKAEVMDALRLVDRNPPDVSDSTPLEREWLVRDWLGGLQAQPLFAEAIALLDSLGQLLQAIGRHPILSPDAPPTDSWHGYADGIREFFNRAVIRTGTRAEEAIGNPWFTFVVLYSPFVTGEHVEFSVVRNHYTRGRPAEPHQLRHWYREGSS
jgi:hypothetical protein